MSHHLKTAFPTRFPLLSNPYEAVSRGKMPQVCSCTVAALEQALITQSLTALVHGGTHTKPSACMQDVESPADPTCSTKNTVQHRRQAQRAALGLGGEQACSAPLDVHAWRESRAASPALVRASASET